MPISLHPNIRSFLKLEMVAADTTSSGNLFQWSTILWLKKCFLNSSLELFLYSFKLCPLNLVVVAFWNNWSELIFLLPVRILYVSIRSPLSLLCCNEYSPRLPVSARMTFYSISFEGEQGFGRIFYCAQSGLMSVCRFRLSVTMNVIFCLHLRYFPSKY